MKPRWFERYNANVTKGAGETTAICEEVDRALQNRIVAAANKATIKLPGSDNEVEILITGARHFDSIMCDLYKALEGVLVNKGHENQGFIDRYGQWHDRKAALKIALAAGQVDVNKSYFLDELQSEDLY